MFSLCLYLSCEHLPFLVVPLMWDWTLISYFSLIHWLLCACITIQCLALRAIILHFHRMFFFFFSTQMFWIPDSTTGSTRDHQKQAMMNLWLCEKMGVAVILPTFVSPFPQNYSCFSGTDLVCVFVRGIYIFT